MRKPLLAVLALGLLAGAFRLSRRPSGPPAPDPAQETARLREEVAALEAQLAALRGRDPVQTAVYQALLAQARRNLMANPMDLSWVEFYRLSEGMKVGEATLIQNILDRLGKDPGLGVEERQAVAEHLRKERAELELGFRERYGNAIETTMLSQSDEEAQRIGLELTEIRRQVRARHQAEFERILPDPAMRAVVAKHLRNDTTLNFMSGGEVTGGVGLVETSPERGSAAPQ